MINVPPLTVQLNRSDEQHVCTFLFLSYRIIYFIFLLQGKLKFFRYALRVLWAKIFNGIIKCWEFIRNLGNKLDNLSSRLSIDFLWFTRGYNRGDLTKTSATENFLFRIFKSWRIKENRLYQNICACQTILRKYTCWMWKGEKSTTQTECKTIENKNWECFNRNVHLFKLPTGACCSFLLQRKNQKATGQWNCDLSQYFWPLFRK